MNIIELAKGVGVEGFLHPLELERLMELATGREVCEVGAFQGLSAWGMAQTAKSVFSVDTFAAATNGQTQMGELQTLEAYKRAVSGFENVSYYVGTSEQAASIYDCDFDMIFLDAMHDYDSCLADINRWYPKVRAGGIFCAHDYRHRDWPGVEQAMDEVFGPAPEGTTVVTLRWIEK